MHGINRASMAYLNRMLAMSTLYKEEKLGKKDLADRLNLTIPAISNILKDLESSGYLVSTGKLKKSYGQHQGYWSIAPDKDCFLCMIILPKEITYIVTDARINPLSELITLKVKSTSIENYVNEIISIIKSIIIKYPKITKIAVGSRGIIDYENGNAIMIPDLLKNSSYPLREKIMQEINLPIKIDNNCNVYALSEKWLGLGMNIDNYIWINMDNGIGSGIIFAGNIYRGKNYTAGEIGHIEIAENGEKCLCGNRGCLTMYVSTEAVLKRFMKKSKVKNTTLDTFLKQLNNDDKNALDVVKETAFYMKKGLSPVIDLISPEHIFIGGKLSKMGDVFLEYLCSLLKEQSIYSLYKNDGKISISKLSNTQLVSGAAFLWIEEELKFI